MRQQSEHRPKSKSFDVVARSLDPDFFEEEFEGIDEDVVRLCEEMRELDDA